MSTVDDAQVYRAAEWPHGLRCAACHELFVEDQPIAERLDAFQDDIPILVPTCVACDVAGVPLDDE